MFDVLIQFTLGFLLNFFPVYITVNALSLKQLNWGVMDEMMKQFQQGLIEVEIEAENLLLARHEVIGINMDVRLHLQLLLIF